MPRKLNEDTLIKQSAIKKKEIQLDNSRRLDVFLLREESRFLVSVIEWTKNQNSKGESEVDEEILHQEFLDLVSAEEFYKTTIENLGIE